ncbi:MAG TPA: hypothetical protein VEA40_21925 [Ramlibacter sp.]|nr:hypothetical protein [Ramlibacter sp.]
MRHALALLTLAAAAAALPPAHGQQKDDRAFQEATRQYQAGRKADAYGRFIALANAGDPDAAHIALFMHRYGPQLYGTYWDANPDDVVQWAALIRDRHGRQQPVYVPDPYRIEVKKPVARGKDKVARTAPRRTKV